MSDLDVLQREVFGMPGTLSGTGQPFGRVSDDDLELIRKGAPAGEALRAEDLFGFASMPSNTEIDSYFTRMDPQTTLRNYVEDANAGRPLMNSHRTGGSFFNPKPTELPIGRTYRAHLRGEGESTDMIAQNYLTLGVHPNGSTGPSTDDLARLITTGQITDLSIGFSLGRKGYLRCGICDANLFKEDCNHVPGVEYPSERTGEKELCFMWVVNGRMNESSLVWLHATPRTTVLKAERMWEAGKLSRAQALEFEQRAGVPLLGRFHGYDRAETTSTSGWAALPAHDHRGEPSTASYNSDSERAKAADAREVRELAAIVDPTRADDKDAYSLLHHHAGDRQLNRNAVEQALSRLPSLELSDQARTAADAHLRRHLEAIKQKREVPMSPAEFARALGLTVADTVSLEEVKQLVERNAAERESRAVAALQQKLAELEPQAADGRAYRADLVQQALAEGVKAMGDAFQRESVEAMLTLAAVSTAQIKLMRDQYAEAAKRIFNPDGRTDTTRQTQPVPSNLTREENPDLAKHVDPSAYRAGRQARQSTAGSR